MAAGAVSLRKSHDIVILSFCNMVKGQAKSGLEMALKKKFQGRHDAELLYRSLGLYNPWHDVTERKINNAGRGESASSILTGAA